MLQPPCLVLLQGTALVPQLAPLIFVAQRGSQLSLYLFPVLIFFGCLLRNSCPFEIRTDPQTALQPIGWAENFHHSLLHFLPRSPFRIKKLVRNDFEQNLLIAKNI